MTYKICRLVSLPSTQSTSQYDLTLFAVGYERRARYIAETHTPRSALKLGCAFPDAKVLSFQENCEWFSKNGYEVLDVSDDLFDEWWTNCLRRANATSKSDTISIGVDISCFNRFKIASIFDGIRNLEGRGRVLNLSLWYSLAQYSPPPDNPVGNRHVGPIHPSFAGWFPDAELPVVAVVGLGYEQDKALGALEHLQVDQAWAFIPSSPIKEYEVAVNTANEILLRSIPAVRCFQYALDQPLNTIANLQSLCTSLATEHNIVMLPFGPKLFVAECLVIAALNPAMAVWRVSAGTDAVPAQRWPSKHIFTCQIEWQSVPPLEEGTARK